MSSGRVNLPRCLSTACLHSRLFSYCFVLCPSSSPSAASAPQSQQMRAAASTTPPLDKCHLLPQPSALAIMLSVHYSLALVHTPSAFASPSPSPHRSTARLT